MNENMNNINYSEEAKYAIRFFVIKIAKNVVMIGLKEQQAMFL